MTNDEDTSPARPNAGLSGTPRQRRLDLVLGDLGLLDLVGREWAHVTDDGALFAPLSERQVDRLLRRLEEILDATEPVPSSPGAGQFTLDLDPVPGPVPVAREAGPHLDRNPTCR